MKIIAFFPGVYPNGFSAMSYRLHYYMKALQYQGAEVEVVMPTEKLEIDGIFEDIPFSFIKVSKQNRFNRKKIVNEHAAICSELAMKCDVVFTCGVNNSNLKLIANSVHRSKCKIAIEVNENPYSIFGSRLDTKVGLLLQRLIFLNFSLKKPDGIIVISKLLFELISHHKRNDSVIVQIPILSGKNMIKREIKHVEIPYILHAGALSEQKDGIKAMLQAFAVAHKKLNRNLKFIFTNKVGFPSLLNWINKFVADNGLENYVEFKGMISKDDLDELYNNCSLTIVNKPSNAQNDFNFPTKLTEILPREIPLIISKTGELKNYFFDKKNAFLVEANNVEQISNQIIYIMTHPVETAQITQNGRLLAEKEFFYLNHSENLYSFFKQVVKT